MDQHPDIVVLKEEISRTAHSFENKIKEIETRAHQTLDHLKDNLSIRHHIEKRPLLFLAGSFVAGVVVAKKIFSRSLEKEEEKENAEPEHKKTSLLPPLAIGVVCTLLGNAGKRKIPEMEPYISAAQASVISEVGHSVMKRILQ